MDIIVYLFCNKSQMKSKCGNNKTVAHKVKGMLLLNFGFFCDLLLNRPTPT